MKLVKDYCNQMNIELNTMVSLLKKYEISYFRVGKEYFVQDESSLKEVMLRHFANELDLRKERKASAKARADNNKEIFKIKSILLENGFTPSEIKTFLSDNENINLLKNTLRKDQNITNNNNNINQTGGTNQ